MFDIGVILVFGIVGFIMEKCEVPLPPMILRLILGPMIEENLRVGLIKTSGSFLAFVSRPISIVLFTIIILLFFGESLKKLFYKIRKKSV